MHFQQKILDRYTQHKRNLPRRDTFDQYLVLISETMLQQTQVDRVIPKFHAFIETFPTLQDLASAPKELLLLRWSGLGFNSRALRLQSCAQQLIEKHNAILPKDRDLLRTLPGVGPYTSGALLAFVYNLPVAVIDTNIRRVYIHELNLPKYITQTQLEEIIISSLPEGRANDWYNALMDYGSLVLTSKKTGIKPLSKQSRFQGSRRQVRGNVIKYLLHHGPTARTQLAHLYVHDDFDHIIDGMIGENLLFEEQSILRIA